MKMCGMCGRKVKSLHGRHKKCSKCFGGVQMTPEKAKAKNVKRAIEQSKRRTTEARRFRKERDKELANKYASVNRETI